MRSVFVQDWGSLIGLQVVGSNPDWFDRLNDFVYRYRWENQTLTLDEDWGLARVTKEGTHCNKNYRLAVCYGTAQP